MIHHQLMKLSRSNSKEVLVIPKAKNNQSKLYEISEVKARDCCVIDKSIGFTPLKFQNKMHLDKRQRVEISYLLPDLNIEQSDEFSPYPYDEIELQLRIITGKENNKNENNRMLQINQNIKLKRPLVNKERTPFQVLEERDTSKQHAEFRRKIKEQELKEEDQQRRMNLLAQNNQTQDESMETVEIEDLRDNDCWLLAFENQHSEPAKDTTRNNEINENKENFLTNKCKYKYY